METSVEDQHPAPWSRRVFLVASAAASAAGGAAASASPPAPLSLRGASVALILVDLQQGNAALPFVPQSFAAIVERGRALAQAVRATDGLVVHTRTIASQMIAGDVDVALPPGGRSARGDDLVAGCPVADGDVVVAKRQWGAFYGTDLDQQLRRRQVDTLLIAGVATEISIESTAREAYDRGYSLVFARDAIAGGAAATHAMFMDRLFPRMGRVRDADVIASALYRR